MSNDQSGPLDDEQALTLEIVGDPQALARRMMADMRPDDEFAEFDTTEDEIDAMMTAGEIAAARDEAAGETAYFDSTEAFLAALEQWGAPDDHLT